MRLIRYFGALLGSDEQRVMIFDPNIGRQTPGL
jgi:hypothetical protein